MYAFRVMVSTLIILMELVMSWSFVKTSVYSAKTVALIIMVVYGLSLVAIWG